MTWVLALIAILAILGLAASSRQPPLHHTQHYAAQNTEAKTDQYEPPKTVWQALAVIWHKTWGEGDPIAFFTFALVICSGLLVGVAVVQIVLLVRAEHVSTVAANAAKESAEVANRSLVKTQRAFVFLDSFDTHIINKVFRVFPVWKNSGPTPTKTMTNYVNWMFPTGDPPADFDFPDLDAKGASIPRGSGQVFPMFIGSQATILGQRIDIPTDTLTEARDGKVSILIWGWAKYTDQFDAAHETRFARRVEVTGISEETDAAGQKKIFCRNQLYHCRAL